MHKYKIQIILATILCLFSSCPIFAEGLEELRMLCGPSDTLKLHNVTVAGIAVSDCNSYNMELNPNLTYKIVDASLNDRTAYIQEPDGSFGLRIVFEDASYNTLKRYDHVTLDLEDCILVHESNPERFTVRGLRDSSIVRCVQGNASDVRTKILSLSQLKDEDIYTQVTLPDMEMIFKEGSYTDIYEPYAQTCQEIQKGLYKVNNCMDGWASLLRDSSGKTIYMLVNTKCPWRRAGKPLVKGTGPVTGIIVHTPMRRYGGEMGSYSIRPVDETDLGFNKKNKSSWKLLAGWCLDGTNGQQLEFEMLGIQTGVFLNGRKGDRLVSDRGRAKALFWTDSDSYIHLDSDINAIDGEKRGYVNNGAIMFKGPTCGWYDFNDKGEPIGSKSFFVEIDARKHKGECMSFNFSWYAGSQDGTKGWGFPAEWSLQYRIDDGPWLDVRETATGSDKIYLRSLPWWTTRLALPGFSHSRRTPVDCGLGAQQRSYLLPKDTFGHVITVRIFPSTSRFFFPHHSLDKISVSDEWIVRKEYSELMETWIRFGDIFVDYR